MIIGFRSPNVQGAGLSLKAVDVLRQYGSKASLAVDFVARVLDVSVEPLVQALRGLEGRGAVKINGQGHNMTVTLVPDREMAD